MRTRTTAKAESTPSTPATPPPPPQTVPPTAAPASAPAAAQPHSKGRSLTAKFIRVASRASQKETEFLHTFLDECNIEMHSAMEAAFMEGARALGLGFIGTDELDDREFMENLREAWLMMYINEGATSTALRRILKQSRIARDNRSPLDLEDMLWIIEDLMEDENNEEDSARRILSRNPGRVRDAIHAAVKAHPELLTAQNQNQ
jgi:hypothetical protein